MNSRMSIRAWFTLFFVIAALLSPVVYAGRPGWKKQKVNWRISGGSKIKAIHYPKDTPVPTLAKKPKPSKPKKKTIAPERIALLEPETYDLTQPVIANVIDSPPVDGFIPWVVVAVTDKRFPEIDMRFDACDVNSVVGDYLTLNPQDDFAIGIFDTGASAHVMGNSAAIQAGLFAADLITSNTVELSGVTGSVDAWVSQPLGLFIDGLAAIGPGGLDDSNMVGEWNVAIAVGDQFESPNLPTAIGSPLSVYFAAHFRNDQQITVTHNGEDFNSPDILFYDNDDPCIPNYSNIIHLELRPLGGVNVQYFPNLELLEFEPVSPSIIIGNLSQSIFFVHSVDLYENDESAIDKDRFMFDTGAQVTVVGSRIASRLRLDPDYPSFEVEIQGVTGDTIMAPGFYIDSLEIPAIGEWLIFTDVPVILLDVFSPEGGTVDGIIGMNLFIEFNFVLRGGGLFLQDDPTLEFEHIYRIIADIAPEGGDGAVNFLDLAVFVEAWLATAGMPPSPNWNPKCDMAPLSNPDGSVDFLDFAVLAGHWLESTEP